MSHYTILPVHKNLTIQLINRKYVRFTRPEGETRQVKISHIREPLGDASDLPFNCLGDAAKIIPVELFKYFDSFMHSRLGALYAVVAIDIIHHKAGMCYNKAFVNFVGPTEKDIELTEYEVACIPSMITEICTYVKAIIRKKLTEYVEYSFLEVERNAYKEVIGPYDVTRKNIWGESDSWFLGEVIHGMISPLYYAKIIYRHSFHKIVDDDVTSLVSVSTLAYSKFVSIIEEMGSFDNVEVKDALSRSSIRRLPIKASLSIVSTQICTYKEFKEVHDVLDSFSVYIHGFKNSGKDVKALCAKYYNFLNDLNNISIFEKWLNMSFQYV